MKKLIILSYIIALLFLNCKLTYKGEFAWRSIDQFNFNPIEKTIVSPFDFYPGRKNLYFGDNETIWWIYIFSTKLYLKPKFIVVLYSLMNTPQPVEIDLRIVEPEYQDNIYFLKQYYPPLEKGKYLIKIAQEKEQIPFDEVEFYVLSQKEIKQISGPINNFNE